MQVSCSVPKPLATSTLIHRLQVLGIQPIITDILIRAVYEGDDRSLGEAIVEMFAHEADHEITVFYSKEEQGKATRRALRKWEKAEKTAKLHGH